MVKIKRYAIIIRDKEQCKKVDELLKAGGIKFLHYGSQAAEYPHVRFIDKIGNLYHDSAFGSDIYESVYRACVDRCVIISADQFLAHPAIIPHWEKQEEKMIEIDGKEYSESTIQKAMQEYCK